jgi:ubiquinone/menaquinone biosynthesis C-methylase UbiE
MTSTLGASETRPASIGLVALGAGDVQPGQRLLDAGCGDGDATLQAARLVGPCGLALGVDKSAPMVERARRRAGEAGLANVGFLHADARTHRFAPLRFDVILNRLALPLPAGDDVGVANLARALRPGGRLVVVSFDEPERLRARLTRAGLVQPRVRSTDVRAPGEAPTWLISASAPE